MNATCSGRTLDPAVLGTDVPWAVLLRRLHDDPKMGSKTARRWFISLEHLAWEDEIVHPVTFAVAGYFVSGFEILRGRHHEARRWAMIADSYVQFEEPTGLSVSTWLRACKLWLGVE